jgi:hypothetical protein
MPTAAKKKKNDKDLQLLEEMLQAARDAGIHVRTERGSFSSGQCVAKGEDLLILNRRLSTWDRIMVLARELGSRDLSTLFLLPKIRSFIEDVQSK